MDVENVIVLKWRLKSLDTYCEKPKKGQSGQARRFSGGKGAQNSP
jgi:hypothetical protein